jgi:hypothetical protein
VAGGYDLVEALRVDEQGRLYFSGMFGDGGIFRRSPDGRMECIVKGRKAAGGMAFRESGGLVLNGRGMAGAFTKLDALAGISRSICVAPY